MARIVKVYAREIIDSRATPTVEAVVILEGGVAGIASVPSGVSTGREEALELRDRDEKRFLGRGVLKAVSNVNQILGPAIVGDNPESQFDLDQKLIGLDGTSNKSKLGANAILAVSTAACKAAAEAAGMPLFSWIHKLAFARQAVDKNPPTRIPTPVFNLISGGLHGAGNLDFQEFHVIPTTVKPYSEALRIGVEVYQATGQSLVRRGAIHSVGDEGGFAPNLFTNADALEILVEAATNSGYQMGQDLFLGLDVAANTLFKDGKYSIRDRSNPFDSQGLLAFYEELNKKYKLTFLEDPLQEDEWEGWVSLNKLLGSKLMVVGDDLLVTNPVRVKKAKELGATNSILVKPNQIGTITETLDVVRAAREARWKVITSHRSGETNDWFIADFAVGIKSDFVKFGAPARGERVAKYNRLLSIEAELASQKSAK